MEVKDIAEMDEKEIIIKVLKTSRGNAIKEKAISQLDRDLFNRMLLSNQLYGMGKQDVETAKVQRENNIKKFSSIIDLIDKKLKEME